MHAVVSALGQEDVVGRSFFGSCVDEAIKSAQKGWRDGHVAHPLSFAEHSQVSLAGGADDVLGFESGQMA